MNTKEKRIEELMLSMKSFSKNRYHKTELLGEMFALQKEIVEQTFKEEHVATADLKIWDVENHLKQLNEECDHVADEELKQFMESSKILCNLIKAEISGNRGEYKAFKNLEYLESQNRIVRNVELNNGENRTEIDMLVITPKCLTIIEVKNTSKNILIDEDGNYYRTGEFLKWDCNIAEKIALKEEMLGKILESAGYGNIRIRSVVVFTNNRIEVHNKYDRIRTCFVNHLAYVIDGFKLDENIVLNDMDRIKKTIENSACQEVYPFEFDARQYQKDFASLLATLEFAKMKREIQEKNIIELQQYHECGSHQKQGKVKKPNITNMFKTLFSSKTMINTGNTTAIAITVFSGIIVSKLMSKGGLL